MTGYSLIEVVVAIVLLTGLFLAAFSVFDAAAEESAKAERQLIAARLAEKISEELRTKAIASISPANQIPFADSDPGYLYSLDVSGSPALPDLTQVKITVNGPVGNPEQVSVHLTTLLSRQPYP